MCLGARKEIFLFFRDWKERVKVRQRKTDGKTDLLPGNIKSENKDVVVFCIAFYSVLISKKNVDSKHQFKWIFDARVSC